MHDAGQASNHPSAAIVAVGDELVLGESLDTNSQWLATQLAQVGIGPVEHRTVPDDRAVIARTLRELGESVDALLVTGGLGPTADDLTRYGLADWIDPASELVEDSSAMAALRSWFEGRGRTMPDANRVQAMRPASATMIENPHGTAPGLAATVGRCSVYCLPGPPREMRPMFEHHVRPKLPAGATTYVALVHSYGIGESAAAMRLGDMMDRHRTPIVGTTASGSIVTARIRATGGEPEAEHVEEDAREVERRWHPWVFGRGEETLAQAVGALLIQRDETLAVAESCTGGLLGAMVVDASGSSAYFRGGFVTYSNEMKARHLGVPRDDLEAHGAVSRQVAAAMAIGACRAADADHALAITGIAGPDGGSDHKPVGTVFVGRASRESTDSFATEVRRFAFTGDRGTIRDRSAKSALQMLRLSLIGESDAPLLWQVSLDGSPLAREQQLRFIDDAGRRTLEPCP